MKISFQKQLGNRLIGVEFFWLLTIDSRSPGIIVDHFIPELFYDHLMVKRGNVRCVDEVQKTEFDLPKQSLKTIYTHPLTLILSAPLTLFGARLSLNFAESYWEQDLGSNAFGEQRWVDSRVNNLFSFARQVTQTIQ